LLADNTPNAGYSVTSMAEVIIDCVSSTGDWRRREGGEEREWGRVSQRWLSANITFLQLGELHYDQLTVSD